MLLYCNENFCGIFLDASAIIKRKGIELHNFPRIVKHAHFSIILLLLLLLWPNYKARYKKNNGQHTQKTMKT